MSSMQGYWGPIARSLLRPWANHLPTMQFPVPTSEKGTSMSDDPLDVGHQTDDEDLPVEEQPGYQEAYDEADKESE